MGWGLATPMYRMDGILALGWELNRGKIAIDRRFGVCYLAGYNRISSASGGSSDKPG